MIKTQAGERKRTVTVIVGPFTVSLMEDLNKHLAGMTGQQVQSFTDLAGACLNHSLNEWRRVYLDEGLKADVNHFD